MSQTLKAALNYASLGWRVFPIQWIEGGKCSCGKADCQHPGKHPVGKLAPQGRNSATTDLEIIKKWWGQCPQANVGIATGPESGLVVVDIDPRNGGNESRRKLERLGNFPYTVSAYTGGGGEHIIMAHPGNGQKIKSKAELGGYPGIDQKADGGYIVAPPSNHISGGSYSWKIPPANTPLAKIPDWLMSQLTAGDGEPQQAPGNRVEGEIPQGQRDCTLTSMAGSMRRRGMSQESIEAALLVENQKCVPPLPEKEVLKIAKSIAKKDPAPGDDDQANEKIFLPVPPTFPIEVFPAGCQQAVTEIQKAHGVPTEIPACAFLTTAGACVGRARGLRIKQGWVEHGNLWMALVAPSGHGKSPAVREIQRPIFALEKKWFAEYAEALKSYNFQLEQRRLTPSKERTSLGPPPDPPSWQQLIVDDATTESLTDALNGNPRGILWNRDELSGLLADLDKYTKKEGGSKARMMSSYDSGPWKVNRREGAKRAFIPNATLSVFGTIQPKALPSIFSDLDAATGFLPRFLFVNPCRETPPTWTDETVSEATRDYLVSIFGRLLDLDFNEQGNPVIIGVSPGGKQLYEFWFNQQVLEPWQNVEAEIYEAVLAKLRGQCLRFALILHCLEAIESEKPVAAPVTAEIMSKAITLANFFKAHQRNAWQTIVSQGRVVALPALARKVASAILALEGEIVRGMLATGKITEHVNQGLDPRFHVSVKTVGKTAATLRLVTDRLPNGDSRGFHISPTDLQRLKNIFHSKTNAGNVRNVNNPATTGLSGDKSNDGQTSEMTETIDPDRRFRHLTDVCKMPGKAHGDCPTDVSDVSDVCFNNEKEILKGGVI